VKSKETVDLSDHAAIVNFSLVTPYSLLFTAHSLLFTFHWRDTSVSTLRLARQPAQA
jgi:hypothetical protein